MSVNVLPIICLKLKKKKFSTLQRDPVEKYILYPISSMILDLKARKCF